MWRLWMYFSAKQICTNQSRTSWKKTKSVKLWRRIVRLLGLNKQELIYSVGLHSHLCRHIMKIQTQRVVRTTVNRYLLTTVRTNRLADGQTKNKNKIKMSVTYWVTACPTSKLMHAQITVWLFFSMSLCRWRATVNSVIFTCFFGELFSVFFLISAYTQKSSFNRNTYDVRGAHTNLWSVGGNTCIFSPILTLWRIPHSQAIVYNNPNKITAHAISERRTNNKVHSKYFINCMQLISRLAV